MKVKEPTDYVNTDLDITVNKNLRFKLPSNIVETLRTGEEDVLLLKIEGIKKLPKILVEL